MGHNVSCKNAAVSIPVNGPLVFQEDAHSDEGLPPLLRQHVPRLWAGQQVRDTPLEISSSYICVLCTYVSVSVLSKCNFLCL